MKLTIWLLSQSNPIRLLPIIDKGSVVHNAQRPGPTLAPPSTLCCLLRVTTVIWFFPVPGFTLITVGKLMRVPSTDVTEARPNLTLVPICGLGRLLSKNPFCKIYSVYYIDYQKVVSCRWSQFPDHQGHRCIFPSSFG